MKETWRANAVRSRTRLLSGTIGSSVPARLTVSSFMLALVWWAFVVALNTDNPDFGFVGPNPMPSAFTQGRFLAARV